MLEGIEVPRVARMTHDDVPEGMRTDARATWPSPELIESWLGDSIFDLRPGEEVEVDRVVIIGRAPEARRFTATQKPRLLAVPSPQQEISSTHLEVRPGSGADHGSAVVTDLGSTNGTLLTQPGLPQEPLRPGIPVQLLPGAVIDLGDGIAHLECSIHAVHEAGDHYVVIGRVLGLEIGDVDDPLLFFRGRYATTEIPTD